jgi:hypothetical protein
VLTPAEARTFVAWSNYLSAGPETWSSKHAPQFTPDIRSTIWQIVHTDTQGEQLANPMIDYLLWRRSLNPHRFDSNHPFLSPKLAELLKTPSLPAGVPPPTYTPVSETATSPQNLTGPTTSASLPLSDPAAQTISPAVPEPGSLVLGLGMLGWGLWWRRRMAQASRATTQSTAA